MPIEVTVVLYLKVVRRPECPPYDSMDTSRGPLWCVIDILHSPKVYPLSQVVCHRPNILLELTK